MKKWMTGAAAVLIATMSFAQPPAQGKMGAGQEFHKKGHRGSGHHRSGMAFSKLNLSEAQKEQMKGINEDFKSQMQTLNKKENITVKEQRDQRSALAKTHREKIQNILTPDQKSQLAQMKEDAKKKQAEMAAKRMDKMKAELNLSDAQVASLKGKQEASKNKMQAIMKNEQLDRESKKEQMMAIRSDMKKNLDEVLTPEQKQKWEELKKEQHEKMKNHKGRMHGKEAVK
jgi:Spy/CpxP family protein refolding chaperone